MAKAAFGEFAAFDTQGGIRFMKNSKLTSEKDIPPEVVAYLRKQLGAEKPKFPMPSEAEKAKLKAESLKVKPELARTATEMEAAREQLTPEDFEELSPSEELPLTAKGLDIPDTLHPRQPYTVLRNKMGGGIEYPRGVAHKPGDIIFLNSEEASGFAEGLIMQGEHNLPDPPDPAAIDPDFLESVSIHTAPIEVIAEALFNRFGLYSVYLDKLPVADEINPLTGEMFSKYHLGIAYQAAIRAKNTGLRPAEEGRRMIDEGREASKNFQVDPAPRTMGEARRMDSFDYRTSPQGTRSVARTEIVHVKGADGKFHAEQREIPEGEVGKNNGAITRFDADEEQPLVQPQFGKKVIRPDW